VVLDTLSAIDDMNHKILELWDIAGVRDIHLRPGTFLTGKRRLL